MNDPIDIVIPWVDGNDPVWRDKKNQFSPTEASDFDANINYRYESWDNLNYLLRAIEKFMPWYHRIFLITDNQTPDFLNVENEKLRIVDHKEYIPDKYLPTFNTHTIEMNMWRIKDLSENFVYFNDDVFPLQPIDEEYLFKDNMVCDEAIEGIIFPSKKASYMGRYEAINNMKIINRHFNKREVQSKNPEKWFNKCYGELEQRNEWMKPWYDFAGFRNPHMPNAFKKSVIKEIWNAEYEVLDKASRNKFRAYNDVTQYVIRYWQLCTGDFNPRLTLGKAYTVTMDNYKDVADVIRNQKEQTISIDEVCMEDEFITIKKEINSAFETILPEKSYFEK